MPIDTRRLGRTDLEVTTLGFGTAKEAQATDLLLLTGVDRVMLDYGKPTQRPVREMTLAEAKERTVIATRQFARRQLAWWRKDPRIHWLDWNAPDLVHRALTIVRLGRPPESEL